MRKFLIIPAILALYLCLIPSASYSVPIPAGEAHNVITAGNIRLTLHQTGETLSAVPGTALEASLWAENTGEFPAFVRISVTSAIKTPREASIPADSWVLPQYDTAHWICRDGFYYYYRPLQPGEATEPLYSRIAISPAMDNRCQDGIARITAAAWAVQSAHNTDSPTSAAGWPEL